VEYFNVLRWVHVLAGAAWFGAVVLINVAIVPSLGKLDKDTKAEVLAALFPLIFKFASFASVIAVGAGSVLLYLRYHTSWPALWETHNGRGLLAGVTLGVALTLFHFILEPKLEAAIYKSKAEPIVMADVLRKLKIIPRGGLAVITLIVVLMMYGARGA
jgi:uncharacterized membrane protein